MPYQPSDFSVSERRAKHPLHDAEGPAGRKSAPRSAGWWARWRRDDATHVWVRLSMYAVLGIIALLALTHTLQTQRKEGIRSTDAKLVALSAQQGALNVYLGIQGLRLLVPGADVTAVRGQLAQALAQARDAADELDTLLKQQAKLNTSVAQ